VGNGAQHFNGTSWGPVQLSGTQLLAAWAYDSNTVFASGFGGALYKYNGSSWSSIGAGAPAYSYYAIWGFGPYDVWASGYNGSAGVAVLIHWNGSSWTTISNPNSSVFGFFSLWGTSSSDIWTIDSSTVYRWRGTSWSPTTISSNGLDGIWGSSAYDVWTTERLSSTSNQMRRYNGSSWSIYSTPLTGQVLAITGTSSSNVWATDVDGNVAQFCGSYWSSKGRVGAATFETVYGAKVLPTTGRVWMLGSVSGSGGASVGRFYALQ
jgi:hypothetical protein